jgi:hypothetical protein
MAAQGDLSKLVSLTFDENPRVRIEAAESLRKLDDPAALFALVELSYDKEAEVRKKAQEILEEKKKKEEDVMSFAEIFSRGNGKDEKDKKKEVPKDKKEKILSPISRIFEKSLGKEKAEKVKKKMMPSIEKLYKNTSNRGKIKNEEHGRKAIQEFLTNYLEAISGVEGDGEEPLSVAEPEIVTEVEPSGEKPELERSNVELDEVGTKERNLDKVSAEIMEVEADDYAEIKEEEGGLERLHDSFFKKAYETMMLSSGDEEVMKKEMKRMVSEAERDIMLAFRLAREKFRERNITNITKVTSGMRNINTDVLLVKEVENLEYQKSKRVKAIATRAIINDEDGNEGVLYLFDDRGDVLKPGMKIKIMKGYAKTFDFSGETALTISKKGSVYIVL